MDRIGFRDEAFARIAELVGVEDVSDEPAKSRTAALPVALCRSRPVAVCAADAVDSRLPVQADDRRGHHRGLRSSMGVADGNSCRSAPRRTPVADTIAAALREVTADDSVSAIVLRVDSPGGSVTASETIWREVKRARERGKPVVASMGAMAASGGYYVSMDADAIVANPGTITGSIGVLSGKLVVRDLKERLGVGSDTVRTNANADVWSADELFTPAAAGRSGSRGGPVLCRFRGTRRRRPQPERRSRGCRCARSDLDRRRRA